MPLKDLMTIIMLPTGLILGGALLILTKRGKLKLETWPRIVGIGGEVYLFMLLMIQSILGRPPSEFLNYTLNNVVLSLAFGIVAYFSARKIARARPNSH